MEPSPRTPLRTHGLRPLGLPRPIRVDTDPRGMPTRIDLGVSVGPRAKRIPSSGAKRKLRETNWTGVLDISEAWRIGEDWWRERPIRRTYFRLVVQGGQAVTVFRDELAAALAPSEANGGWFEQRD